MYKLQFANAFTQEILREEKYDGQSFILEIVDSMEQNKRDKLELFIMDNQKRILKAEFISHIIVREDDAKVYRMFFKVKALDVKLSIR
ncbi:hypothetical protein V7122_16985 [Bacillus sp. JJ1532]|uniref:hypothetical protein n=1 Tax=Bacillus sp. JJ1532 TaxID=3122958 RepID=UPI003000CC5F